MLNFFDLNVHAYPETDVPVEDMLRIAKRYGYAGIAITNHDDTLKDLPSSVSNFVFWGVEIRTKSVSELKRRIKLHYGQVTLLAVHGGNEVINEAALKDSRVDLLAHPCGENGEGELSHVLVRYAAENSVAIDFNINPIIRSKRGDRARILWKMRENLKLVRKYKALAIITSNARSIYDLRAPREIIALASLFGMKKEEAVHALSAVPEGVLKKRWKKKTEVEII
jgi:ribonuclease P/MRP protein subunit RPP1